MRDGDYGLVKTYWVFGVLVNAVLTVVFRIFWELLFVDMGAGEVLFSGGMIFYSVNVLIGTWNAANRYRVNKIDWGFVAKFMTVIGGAIVLVQVFGVLSLLGNL